jgi:hypothetical protein
MGRRLHEFASLDERERSSGTTEIPIELRGRRVMTRLFVLVDELKTRGLTPSVVHLSAQDEFALFASAEQTFGQAGLGAARASNEAWRGFLHTYFRDRVDLGLVLDAPETRVT